MATSLWGRTGIWLSNFIGKDKLLKNVDEVEVVKNNNKTGHEEETYGTTYDRIISELRSLATTNESIDMLANSYSKGIFGAKVSIQNISEYENINNKLEKLIEKFSKKENFELQGRFHSDFWYRFFAADMARIGGVLIRKHKVSPAKAKSKKWELPYKIEVLEISSINFELNDKFKRIYNGVEVNMENKPSRLHFKGGTSVSFDDLIMYSNIKRPTQYHGVTPAYSAINTIRNQEKHATAEVENAEKQAKVSDVYKTSIADTHRVKMQGDLNADLASVTSQEARKVDARLPENEAKIIDKDEEYVRLDRGSYTSAFDSLTKFANTRIAAGSGITLDEYTGDLSDLTFHGGKVAQIKNDETYAIMRDDLSVLVIKEILADMIRWCYMTGYSDVIPNDKNIKIEVIVKPRKSAQPLVEANANEKDHANGFKARSDIVKDSTGENHSEFLRRYVRDELAFYEAELKIAQGKKALEEKYNTKIEEEE